MLSSVSVASKLDCQWTKAFSKSQLVTSRLSSGYGQRREATPVGQRLGVAFLKSLRQAVVRLSLSYPMLYLADVETLRVDSPKYS